MGDLGGALILFSVLSDGEVELLLIEQVEDVLKICVLGVRGVFVGLLFVLVHLIAIIIASTKRGSRV